jgi:hypothetical protein
MNHFTARPLVTFPLALAIALMSPMAHSNLRNLPNGFEYSTEAKAGLMTRGLSAAILLEKQIAQKPDLGLEISRHLGKEDIQKNFDSETEARSVINRLKTKHRLLAIKQHSLLKNGQLLLIIFTDSKTSKPSVVIGRSTKITHQNISLRSFHHDFKIDLTYDDAFEIFAIL